MKAAHVGADIPRHPTGHTPCSRCGVLLAKGGNTAKTPTCWDCRVVEPDWAKGRAS